MSVHDTEAWAVYQEGAFPTEDEEAECLFCGEVGGPFHDGLRCECCAEEQDDDR